MRYHDMTKVAVISYGGLFSFRTPGRALDAARDPESQDLKVSNE